MINRLRNGQRGKKVQHRQSRGLTNRSPLYRWVYVCRSMCVLCEVRWREVRWVSQSVSEWVWVCVPLVELLMMKQRLGQTEGCWLILCSHSEDTSAWDKHVSRSLGKWTTTQTNYLGYKWGLMEYTRYYTFPIVSCKWQETTELVCLNLTQLCIQKVIIVA